MKTKKIIALVLAVVLALSLVACGTKTETNDADDTEGNVIEPVNYSYGLDDTGYYTGVSDLSEYVKLPDDYLNNDIDFSLLNATDEALDTYMEYLATVIGTKVEITDEDAVAEKGNVVNIDFVGTVDDLEINGGSAKGAEFTLGDGTYLTDLEYGIMGHKTGEMFAVSVTFPEDYGTTTNSEGEEIDLSNKKAFFTVTLNGIYKYELTDELIADYFSARNEAAETEEDKVLTIDAARKAYYQEYYDNMLQTYAVAAVVDKAEVTIPDEVMDAYVHTEMALVDYNAASAGMDSEYLVQINGYDTLADYEADVRENATEYLNQQLILLAIAQREGLEFDADLCAKTFGSPVDELIDTYGQGYIYQNTLCYEAIELISNSANIVKNAEVAE